MGKMNKPTKGDLYKMVDDLLDKLDEEKQKRWCGKIPQAAEVFYKTVGKIFPGMLKNVQLEHIDEAGFWFTFELINDSRRQTYAIRHNEVDN